VSLNDDYRPRPRVSLNDAYRPLPRVKSIEVEAVIKPSFIIFSVIGLIYKYLFKTQFYNNVRTTLKGT